MSWKRKNVIYALQPYEYHDNNRKFSYILRHNPNININTIKDLVSLLEDKRNNLEIKL